MNEFETRMCFCEELVESLQNRLHFIAARDVNGAVRLNIQTALWRFNGPRLIWL
jgi:hypothetical protein